MSRINRLYKWLSQSQSPEVRHPLQRVGVEGHSHNQGPNGPEKRPDKLPPSPGPQPRLTTNELIHAPRWSSRPPPQQAQGTGEHQNVRPRHIESVIAHALCEGRFRESSLDHLVVRCAHVAFDGNGGDLMVQDGLDELRDEIHLRLDRKDHAGVACSDVWADDHE